jgi:hypothetical protein
LVGAASDILSEEPNHHGKLKMNRRSAKASCLIMATFTVAMIPLFLIGFYAFVWFLNAWPHPQTMARSGYPMIPEAKQIDDLLGPAWHAVWNYKEPNIVECGQHVQCLGQQSGEVVARGTDLQPAAAPRLPEGTGHVVRAAGFPNL